MPPIVHVHKEDCPRYDYQEWLGHVAPDFLWFNVQDVGSYQGQVFGVALYQHKIAIYEDYYGSCSGCGAWGEGGEPETQDSVVKLSHLFNTTAEALAYVAGRDSYEKPDMAAFTAAIVEAGDWERKSH